MTEAEWLAATGPMPMLEFLQTKASVRKLRLFASACCRTVWNEMWPQSSRDVVASAEEFADGCITEKELNNSRSLACQAAQNVIVLQARSRTEQRDLVLGGRLNFAADAATVSRHLASRLIVICSAGSVQADTWLKTAMPIVLRDIFGNPFRPVTFDPTWRTETALALARGIYDERTFDRLPILADALQDVGCNAVDLLNHLRDPNATHVRGCWALDLVLGKS